MTSLPRCALWTIAVFVAALTLPVSAAAQTLLGEPATGSLRLSISAFGGYDTDVTGAGANPTREPSAPYGGAMASLNYQVRSKKIGFSARGVTDSRYYNTLQPISATAYSGGAAFGVDVTSRLNVGVNANAGYSPRFLFSVLPVAGDPGTDVAPPPLDYGLSAQRTTNYAAGAHATLRLSPRSSLNVTTSDGAYKFLDENYELRTRSYSGGYSYSVTKYAALRAGYREQVADYPAFGTAQRRRYSQRSFDAGVDYSRPLSISRRTTFSFSSGSSAIDDGLETFFTITGNASLRHQIARTWEAHVVYSRGLGIVGGFAEPFFADAVTANLQGRVTNRLMLMATAGISNGNVGLGSRANSYDSFQASTRLEMTLKRERIGLYGSYFYYTYQFDGPTPSATAIPREVARHGVRVGLIVRFPLLKERTPRVTR